MHRYKESNIVQLQYDDGCKELVIEDCYEQFLNDCGYGFDTMLEDGHEHTPSETRVYMNDEGETVRATLFDEPITVEEPKRCNFAIVKEYQIRFLGGETSTCWWTFEDLSGTVPGWYLILEAADQEVYWISQANMAGEDAIAWPTGRWHYVYGCQPNKRERKQETTRLEWLRMSEQELVCEIIATEDK